MSLYDDHNPTHLAIRERMRAIGDRVSARLAAMTPAERAEFDRAGNARWEERCRAAGLRR